MNNNFLNSESVFEVIGNYPITDPLDVLYTGLLSGSYTDNYITGAMLTKTRNPSSVGAVFTPGDRGLVFSKINNTNKYPNQKLPVATSYDLQPFSERAGITRILRVFSNNERFYDSLLPDITQYVERLGGEIIRREKNGMIRVGYAGANNALLADTEGFFEHFPFEPKFSSIPRRKNLASSIVATIDEAGTSIPPFICNGIIVFEREGLSHVGSYNIFGNASFQATWYNHIAYDAVISPLTPPDSTKLLFGFGDRNEKYISPYASPDGFATGSNGKPDYRLFYTEDGDDSQYIGPIIRGWKYGLHDGNPHYTSCVFRRDRYGQLRDMLEQRLHPATYIDEENSPNSKSLFEEEPLALPKPVPTIDVAVRDPLKKSGMAEYPIAVNFVRQQINENTIENTSTLAYVQTSPVETWSSNMSTYATSSLPYFDLEKDSLGRNRGAIPSIVLNPTYTATAVD